jgi:hypothetical protein
MMAVPESEDYSQIMRLVDSLSTMAHFKALQETETVNDVACAFVAND